MPRKFLKIIGHTCCVVIFSTIIYANEQRNYWKECLEAGKVSIEELIAYLDTLSVEQVMLLGNQAWQEYEQRSECLVVDNEKRLHYEYMMKLMIVHSYFIDEESKGAKQLEPADIYRIFIEPIADQKATSFLRQYLMSGIITLRSESPEAFRRHDYEVLSVLMDVIKMPDENIDLRTEACRTAYLCLYREHINPVKPLSEEERDALSKRLDEHVKLCEEIVADTDAPPSLRKQAERSLLEYEKSGLLKTGKAESGAAGGGLRSFEYRLQIYTNTIPNLQQRDLGEIKLEVTIDRVERGNEQYIVIDVKNTHDNIIYLNADYHQELLDFLSLAYQSQDGAWKPLKHILYGQMRAHSSAHSPGSLLVLRPSFSIRFEVSLSRFQLPDEGVLPEYKIRCEAEQPKGKMKEMLIDLPTISYLEIIRLDMLIYGDLVPTVSNEITVKPW